MMDTTLAIGTEKGAFLLDGSTAAWETEGPLFPGWKVTAFGTTPSGSRLAALASNWFGASIHRSAGGEDWVQVAPGPEPREGRKLEQIWTFAAAGPRIYAGVAEAGLFSSDDDGLGWQPVEALNSYPGSDDWFPGLGGLAAHHVLTDGDRLWVGISAVGVFRSDDGGRSFVRCDAGIHTTVEEEAEPGFCVHGIAHDPDDADRMWRQDHSGVYRSFDAGDSWERIEDGLPAGFGFVMRRHHPTGRLFVVPLAADTNRVPIDGRFAVYRSDDDGASWEVSGTGFPSAPTFTAVLRRSIAVTDSGLVAVGTTGGKVWLSRDAGDTWSELPHSFPRILTVDVL